MGLNFLFFHAVYGTQYSVETREFYSHRKNISSNQLVFSDFFSKCVAFTKFLPKKCESKFMYFPHCALVISTLCSSLSQKNSWNQLNLHLFWFSFENVEFTKFLWKKCSKTSHRIVTWNSAKLIFISRSSIISNKNANLLWNWNIMVPHAQKKS